MADEVPEAADGSDASSPSAIGVMGGLRKMCETAARTLLASGVGMSVMVGNGVRGLATASDAATERVEELQFTLGEGPCIDAFASRRPVLMPDLEDGGLRRWPVYASAVQELGIRAVFAFPMQVGAARLGVLDVFRRRPGALSPKELSEALTLADLAVVTLLDGHDRASPADGLDGAVERRAELFQAQGMVMVQLGSTIAEAMTRIRAYAFASDRRLDDVAADIVARRLTFDRDHP